MPTIALTVAAVLLLVVGALSYRDYVRSSLEQEYTEKEARLMQRSGLAPTAPPVEAAPTPAAPNVAPNTALNAPVAETNLLTTPPAGGTVLYDAQGNPVYVAGPVTYPQAAGAEVEANLPVPQDPDITQMQESLDRAREQSRLTEQRYNQLAGGGTYEGAPPMSPTSDAMGNSGSETEITAELPDFLRNAVENPPGGNPEVEARLNRMRAQVTAAPSLAKVTSYDKDWGIVTFNAGATQLVKVGQRFAVRRGAEILGWVKVDQVEEQQAIATLVTKNRDSDTALKPDVGDDLIDFELF